MTGTVLRFGEDAGLGGGHIQHFRDRDGVAALDQDLVLGIDRHVVWHLRVQLAVTGEQERERTVAQGYFGSVEGRRQGDAGGGAGAVDYRPGPARYRAATVRERSSKAKIHPRQRAFAPQMTTRNPVQHKEKTMSVTLTAGNLRFVRHATRDPGPLCYLALDLGQHRDHSAPSTVTLTVRGDRILAEVAALEAFPILIPEDK